MTGERRGRGWPRMITQPFVLMHASTKEGWASLVASRYWSAATLHSMTHQDCDPGHLREYLKTRFRHTMPDSEILENLAQRQVDRVYQRGELKRINLAIRTRSLLGEAGLFKSSKQQCLKFLI